MLRNLDKKPIRLHGHAKAVRSVAFSPIDPHLLASASEDGTIRFWDVRPALSREVEDDAEHDASRSPSTIAQKGSVRAAEFRWDGSLEQYVVRGSGGSDRSFPLRLPKSIGKPEASWFSPDGRWLALPSDQGPLLLFDLQRSDSPIAVLGERGLKWRAVQFDDDRARIIATSDAGERRVWQHFDNVNALMKFAKRSLPVESEGAGTPPAPVRLRDTELCKLRGGMNLFALSGASGDSESCD